MKTRRQRLADARKQVGKFPPLAPVMGSINLIAMESDKFAAQNAARLDRMGGILRCRKCGDEIPLGQTAQYNRTGWPTCCGQIRVWLTAKDLATGSKPGHRPRRPSPHRWPR
jgi:hypothetical protein